MIIKLDKRYIFSIPDEVEKNNSGVKIIDININMDSFSKFITNNTGDSGGEGIKFDYFHKI